MDRKDIQKLYKKCHTPLHVQKHMHQVSEVAGVIAAQMKHMGRNVDQAFINDLALVHDLMKAIAFKEYNANSFLKPPTEEDIEYWKIMKKKYKGKDVEATSEVLRKTRQKKLADAVLSQQFDAVISKDHPLKTLEEKVVYYADKRVAHTEIVPLTARLKEGYLRYHGKRKPKSVRLKKIELAIYMLEEEIFTMKDTIE